MFPNLNFNIVLDKYINSFINKDGNINNNDLAKHGFINNNNNCEQFILSILYKLEPVYYSANVDSNVKSSILTLWNQFIKRDDYRKQDHNSFNNSFNQSFN